MRIIAGEKKGHLLHTPKGLLVRPTADRVKESLFSILGGPPQHARVLDLFAGTGALGLESLSRGAEEAVFVEHHPSSIQSLERNIIKLGYQKRAKVIKKSVNQTLAQLIGPFHWVFIDPPYQEKQLNNVLDFLGSSSCFFLEQNSVVIAEFSTAKSLAAQRPALRHGKLVCTDERSYGQTGISFYQLLQDNEL